MIAQYTAILDANVLYPAPLRDLLLRMAIEDLFFPRWTERIRDEWTRSLLARHRDLSPTQVERTRRLMDAHVPDALVTEYEQVINGLELPDPDDRHVLAVAIKTNADFIVTCNLADFPAQALDRFGIVPLHPDDFIAHLFDLNQAAALRAVRAQRASLKKPTKAIESLLQVLLDQGLPKTVDRLKPSAAVL